MPPLLQNVPPNVPPEWAGTCQTLPDAIARRKAGFHRRKQKGRTFLELCGLVNGAGAGTPKRLETRMNARFLPPRLKTYQQKYQQKEKCLPFGGIPPIGALHSFSSIIGPGDQRGSHFGGVPSLIGLCVACSRVGFEIQPFPASQARA